jgi:TRAP-type C4-dicarboxylate transport system substrate-binding protein
MKPLFSPFARIAVAAGLTLAASAALAQDNALKFHHMWPTVGMGHKRVVAPWCDKVAQESNNRLRCQILPAMTGGGTPRSWSTA